MSGISVHATFPNLDAALRVQMRTEISRLHSRLKTTTIYVTHDQVEAMTLADRIVVMRDGEIQQVGAPLELYNRPDNRFVAGFIGTPAMNFVEGALGTTTDTLTFEAGGISIPLPDAKRESLGQLKSGKLVLGIRPPDLKLVDGATSDQHPTAASAITARVEVREPMGSEVYLYLESPWGNLVARVSSSSEAREGDQVQLAVPTDRVHLFDGDSQRSLQ